MGIKGIYKEIGPGERISLCKLAIGHLEQTGQPLRLAIDFSIWQFQVQAAKGGANPAIRTLFYRLVRLLGLAIHPIFVFDGPNKPAFKRNKRSGRGDGVATAMAKRLIRLFGFATHDGPGEAEAECALLEQQGIVDAVLSEDVDTIMFGCRRTLRNWSAEGTKGSKTPTHVSMYDADAVAAGTSGLNREGMVLVALMSGGDYAPEGVPGCGVKVACEAARAGFGRDLCRIKRADGGALTAWRTRLRHELCTNESGFFRTRHKALDIPENFPNLEVLRYYTHPVVSPVDRLKAKFPVDRLKAGFPPAATVDVVGLREFARETFDWAFRIGAVKLTRVLAPSLLVQRFLERYVSADGHHDDLVLKQKEESLLIKAISSKRAHFSTDATPELRISFIPANVVKLDLGAEPEEEVEGFGRSGIALNSDDEFDEEAAEEVGDEQVKSANGKKPFDPLQPDLVWIPETLAKLGVPLTVEDWEGKQRLKEQLVAAKAATRKTRAKKTDMPVGALDKYVKVTKSVDSAAKESAGFSLGSSPPRISALCEPPAATRSSKQSKKSSAATQASKPPADVNPWTLASSQISARVAKSLPASTAPPQRNSARDPIIISSSPVAPASPPAVGACMTMITPTKTKRLQSPQTDDSLPPALLFAPSPSARTQRSSAAQQRCEQGHVAPANIAQPARKPRPFKRAKSGADGKIGTKITQKSMKGYGQVSKNACSSTGTTKATLASTAPIELLSDNDNPPHAPVKSPLKRTSNRTTSHSHGTLGEDSDPFSSPPESSHRLASQGITASISKPEQLQQSRLTSTNNDTTIASNQDPSATTAITTTSETSKPTTASATTKLYMPRTSLGGLGYYTVVEVSREEADRLTTGDKPEGTLSNGSGAARLGSGRGKDRGVWRLSEIEVLDLTAGD